MMRALPVVAQLTSFIGRTLELAEIAALLADPACRLLTLVGPGGIGKTRLAIEAAKTINFPNGVHFVALQPVSDAALLPIAIANAIGIQFFGADEPRVQLFNFLRGRQMLLILDNFEHLADGVDFVGELLTAPGVKLLVTSRTALNIQAEWRYTVTGLEMPGDLASKGDSASRPYEDYDAVKLFTGHARRLRHNFSLADHRAEVIRICQLTEGMPLALELAAGWLKALSCAEIANEIQRNLDFLAADVRDVPERHRSMTAIFSQSWGLLTDDEQKIFGRMSVFRGGFFRVAAEKVAGATLHTLASLVDQSLLRVSSTGRYDVHELLRQYGEAKLAESGEVEAIRDAHSAYYLDFLAQREADIKGRRQIAALDEIEADLENVRVAWYRGADQQNEAAISCAVGCLTLFCGMRNRVSEHETWYTYAQGQFTPKDGNKPRLVYAQLMTRRASVILNHDHRPVSQELCSALLEKSLLIVPQYDNPLEMGIVLMEWATYLIFTDKPGAWEVLERSLSIFQDLQDTFHLAGVLNWIAWYYVQTYQFQRAIETIDEYYKLALRTGNIHTAGWGAWFMSVQMTATGQYGERERWLHEALRLMQQMRNGQGIASTFMELSNVAVWKGNFDEARSTFNEGFYLAEKYNSPRISSLGHKGSLANFAIFVDEDYAAALRIFDEARAAGFDRPLLFMTPALCGLGEYEAARKILYPKLRRLWQHQHVDGLHTTLIFAALILEGQSEKEWAAQLMGFISTWHPDVTGLTEKWGLYIRTRARLQAELGHERFAAAWEQGKNLDLIETAAKILEAWRDLDDASPAQSPDALTERELEVLRLVAAGLSNSQIAERLVISVGTAKAHIHNIYGKLGVESRTQAIARARELHLL